MYECYCIVATCVFVLSAIGKVTNVVLTHGALQWDPSEVRSGDNSSVLYNVTIAHSYSSVPVVSGTTENTSLSLNSGLFKPCENYSISISPYQKTTSGIEEGIPVQIFEEYPGGKLLIVCYVDLHVVLLSTIAEMENLTHAFFLGLPVASSINVTVTRATHSANITISFLVSLNALDINS